jgi:hypothetical protein
MLSASFHDTTYSPVAECLVRTEGAFLHGTFELSFKSLDEPVHFEVYARVDHVIEVAA